MSGGAMIAIHAAVAKQARDRVIDAFRVRGATAPERAVPWAQLNIAEGGSALEELIAAGVVRPVDNRGRLAIPGDSFGQVAGYYLDEAAVLAHRDRSVMSPRKAAIVLAILTGLLVAGLLVLLIQRGKFPS